MSDPTPKSEIVRMQEDLTYGLLSWSALATINVVQMRKLRQESEVNADAIYAAPRGGKSGCGVLVEMPTVVVEHPSAPGPQEMLAVTAVILEEPNLNMNPVTGTMLEAEIVGLRVRRFMHGWFLRNKGELYSQKTAMVPTEEWPGLVAYRVGAAIQLVDDVWARSTAPTISQPAAFEVELTNPDSQPNAAIFYTLDGSYPGSGNPGALPYNGPIVLQAAGLVRYAAFQDGYLPSAVEEACVDAQGVAHHPTLGT